MAKIKSFTPNMPSVYWMAPEIAAKSQPYQKPVDIWSLGCTVLEMLTRRKPFEYGLEEGASLKEVEVVERLKKGQLPHVPRKLSTTARKFLEKCLQFEPEDRPTAEDLLEDPFVNPCTSFQYKAPGVVFSEDEVQEECLSLSVEDICDLLSKLLESETEESSAVMISTAWLKKWQVDDDQVYRKLLDAGYAQTFETDTYSCFERVCPTSDEQCNVHCLPNYAVANERPNDTAVQDCPQDLEAAATESIKSTHGDSVDYVKVTGTHDQKNADALPAGNGEESEQDALTAVAVEHSQLSGAPSCRGPEHCPPIPLTVVFGLASTSAPSPERIAQLLMRFERGPEQYVYKVHLALSCCFRGRQMCVTVSSLKAEIFNFPKGAALTETRLSIAAAVDGDTVTLVPVNLTSGAERGCSEGFAKWNCDSKKGENPWQVDLAPSIQTPLGGGSLGKLGYQKEKKVAIPHCRRDDPLKLVTLSIGDSGCWDIGPRRSVLVLKRDPVNTVLAGKDNDLTCVDLHGELTPLVLECDNIYDYVGDINPKTSVEITCCVKIEVAVFPDMDKKVKKEGVIPAKRKSVPSLSTCEERGTGHATFKGVLRHEIRQRILSITEEERKMNYVLKSTESGSGRGRIRTGDALFH